MNERMKILEMLKDGKITAEEADKLLTKLEQLDQSPGQDDFVVDEPRGYTGTGYAVGTAPQLKKKKKSSGRKYFCIKINSAKGKNINLRLPMMVARAGVKMSALLPESATEALREKGIDLDEFSNLKGDELNEALEAVDIKITTDEGDNISIYSDE